MDNPTAKSIKRFSELVRLPGLEDARIGALYQALLEVEAYHSRFAQILETRVLRDRQPSSSERDVRQRGGGGQPWRRVGEK
mgnify:CR=1 FL=1